MIFGEFSHIKDHIQDILLFLDSKGIYVQGKNKQSIFGSDLFTSKVLVVRIVPR